MQFLSIWNCKVLLVPDENKYIMCVCNIDLFNAIFTYIGLKFLQKLLHDLDENKLPRKTPTIYLGPRYELSRGKNKIHIYA